MSSAFMFLAFFLLTFQVVTPLQVQLQQFETLVTQNKIEKETVREALYVFETGSNDVVSYFFPTGADLPAPDDFVRLMLSEFTQVIQHIYDLGARRIAIFGLGPVGCIPARLTLPNCSADYCNNHVNDMATNYNMGLENLVNELPARYTGVVPVYASVFDVVQLFLTYPQQYGEFNNLF